VQILADGRFTLGVGSGENLNEHVVGKGWPTVERRQEMLREAIQIIRELFTGDVVDWKGDHFQVDSARLWDVPDVPVPIAAAVSGERSVETFAPLADHLVAVEPDKDLVDAWHGARKATGLPGDVRVIGQIPICWDPDRDAAVARAHEQFRWFAGGWAVNADLPTTAGFAGATQFVRPEDTASSIPCGQIWTPSSRRSASSTGRPASLTSRWSRSATTARTSSSGTPPNHCWRSCARPLGNRAFTIRLWFGAHASRKPACNRLTEQRPATGPTKFRRADGTRCGTLAFCDHFYGPGPAGTA